jgi:hypothetical protein
VTGPEHYREAERLLAEAREAIAPKPKRSAYPLEPGQPTSAELYERNIAEAHVHATLALAAATALAATATLGVNTQDAREWNKAAATMLNPYVSDSPPVLNPYVSDSPPVRDIPFGPRIEQDLER